MEGRETERGGGKAGGAATWLIAASFLLVAVRIGLLIRRSAVNVIFWDQWDYLTPEFNGRPIWEEFFWQHGPHRQGLGGVLIRALHFATRWDGVAEAWAALFVMLLAAAVVIATVRKATGRLSPLDAGIPFLFGTIHAYEIYVGTPNLAHGPVPALLVALFAFALFIERETLRVVALLVINFLAIFTGFGIFLGLVTPLLMAIWAWKSWREPARRWRYLAALVISAASLASFRIGYQFQSASTCFKFPDDHPARYPEFMALLLTRPLGGWATGGVRVPVALGVLVGVTAALVWAVRRLVLTRPAEPSATVVFVFSAFALLFAANCAVGRVCGGLEDAASARYVPYSLFGALSVFFLVRTAPSIAPRVRFVVLASLVVVFASKEAFARKQNQEGIEYYAHWKRTWTECFLESGDIERCDKAAGGPIHPNVASSHVAEKLAFLREHHYSLFKDLPPSEASE